MMSLNVGEGCLNPSSDSCGEMIEIFIAGAELEEFRVRSHLSVPIDVGARSKSGICSSQKCPDARLLYHLDCNHPIRDGKETHNNSFALSLRRDYLNV